MNRYRYGASYQPLIANKNLAYIYYFVSSIKDYNTFSHTLINTFQGKSRELGHIRKNARLILPSIERVIS